MASPETDATALAAEEARAEAEARRERILEKGRERLKVVAGEIQVPATEEEAEQQNDGEYTTTSSGAKRMQAMRRRRFKKTAAQTKEAEDATSKETEPSLPEESNEMPTPETTSASNSVTAPPPVHDYTVEGIAAATKTPKKKYKGVAKMRREMVKKKEAAEVKENEPEAVSTTTVPIIFKKAPIPILPILFHFIAVVLLFLAGIDIGWNQVVYSDVVVYRELTLRTEGVGLMNRYKTFSFSKTIMLDPSKLQDMQEFVGEEEFVSIQEQEEVYIPNIDPIFKVDFDRLTQGGGLLNTLAKGAISGHRLLLRIFYYLPISILQTVVAIPQQLLTTPPMLCIISLVVRQSAKLIGAKLPDPASGKKDGKDLLAMMKQGVMNYLAGMFPTVVSVYDVWTHLRSDMYVILCGVFVGLAYTHHVAERVVEGQSTGGGTDEL